MEKKQSSRLRYILPSRPNTHKYNRPIRALNSPNNSNPPLTSKHSRLQQLKYHPSPRSEKENDFFSFNIQELCLANNKWLIFDEQGTPNLHIQQQESRAKFSREIRRDKPLAKYSSTAIKTEKFKPKERLAKVYFENTARNAETGPADLNREASPAKEKGIIKINFKAAITNTTEERQKATSKKQHSPTQQDLFTHNRVPSKSIKSSKSVKTSKSLKNKMEEITPKKSIKAKPLKKAQKKVNSCVETCKLSSSIPCTSEQQQAQTNWTNFITITQLFDREYLLEPDLSKRPCSSNPYQDYPEWGTYHLRKKIQFSSDLYAASDPIEDSEEPKYLRIPSLMPQFDDNKEEVKVSERYSEMPIIQQNGKLLKQNEGVIWPLQRQRQNAVLSLKDSDMSQSDLTKQRSQVTNNTQNPLMCLDKEQTKKNPLSVIQEQKSFVSPKVSFSSMDYDQSFDLKAIFSGQQKIICIEIKPNEQTALFPVLLSNPNLIVPNHFTRGIQLYKNQQIIQFLNLFLKVQPKTLQQIFQPPKISRYVCRLFDKGVAKRIEVDGRLPFDDSYFPLFGCVEQYIWFAVLLKCLAKMKGSYKAINSINFLEMNQLITPFQLLDISNIIQSTQNPVKLLQQLIRYGKKRNNFLIAKNNTQFYKIDLVTYIKSTSEQQEDVFLQPKLNSGNSQQHSYRALTQFLNKKKKEIAEKRLRQNSNVKLIGAHRIIKIPIMQLLSPPFQIYCNRQIYKSISLLGQSLTIDSQN